MSRRRKPPLNPRRISPTTSVAFVVVALVLFFLARSGVLENVAPASAPARPATVAPAAGVETPTGTVGGAPVAAVTPREVAPDPTGTPVAPAGDTASPAQTPRPSPTANAPPAQPAATRASTLPTIAYADLPPEAHHTIRLIEQGGPFPFDRDGIIFQNRERRLPLHPQGYYREYTVITPGVRTRGARRIVAGQGGEMYYTDDHYESFREIVR